MSTGRGGAAGRGGAQAFGGQVGATGQSIAPIRVQLRPAFNVPRPAVAVVAANVRGRVAQAFAGGAIPAPEVSVESDGVVVLRGTVASDYDRMVAEKVAAMQSGVAEVRNELTINESAAADSQGPTN